MEIQFIYNNNTPVFQVEGSPFAWNRVYGATFNKRKNQWLFPAYPPFLENVLHDLPIVHKGMEFSTEAEAWIESVGNFDSCLETAQNYKSPSPFENYEHQTQGLAELLYYMRWGLRWEAGTGKSKVVLDALNILGGKALILCPAVAVENWVDESELHTGDLLKTTPFIGRTRAQRLKVLKNVTDTDIFVMSYNTARDYGIPHVHKKAMKLFEDQTIYPPLKLRTVLKMINDPKKQVQFSEEWLKGRKSHEIKQEIKETVEGRQWITELPYDTIVYDESHRIKRISSQQTKVALQFAKGTMRRHVLTGTITQGDPRELYPQLNALSRFVIPENYENFTKKFVKISPYNKHIVIGYRNLHILNRRLNFVTSEKLLNDCVDLPPRRDEDMFFELTPKQRKDYNYAVKHHAIERGDADPLELQGGALRTLKMLQLCSGFMYAPKNVEICDTCEEVRQCVVKNILAGSPRCIHKDKIGPEKRETLRYNPNPKLNVLKDLLDDLLEDPKHKVIIWTNFDAEMDDIVACLDKKGVAYVRVDGKTSQNVQEYVREFQHNPVCRVYLAHVKTGIAITLNAAQYVIYYSRPWSSEDWEQSRGRNYRIGQTEKVVVYRLIARGSIEEKQLEALIQKKLVALTLTQRINCCLCDEFSKCLEKSIQPWTKRCILSADMKRVLAKAGMIYPKI